MVPVIDKDRKPLMPCSECRARKLMEKGEALAYWQKGIFCIKLVKEPADRNYQDVALGIDPGSKREGYTVATRKAVVLNITSDTPYWVKNHVETRRNLRNSRRQRHAPYRKERANRASLCYKAVPPSTKARWDSKLRITKQLIKIIPITLLNIEDIKAKTKHGQGKWNLSFSPLEVGKKYFYARLANLEIRVIKTPGFDTKKHRDIRGFRKSNKKLDYSWDAHNVDSHSLTEIGLQTDIKPYLGLYQINFLEYHRRQLHVQSPSAHNIRKPYGTTVSMGKSRGSVARYKNKLGYLGGVSKGGITIHSILTAVRTDRGVNIKNINILYRSSWRTQFIQRQKSLV